MLKTFWSFREVLRPYRGMLAIGASLTVLVALADIAAPWPLKVIVDSVLRGQRNAVPLNLLFPHGTQISTEALLDGALAALFAIVVIGALADYLGTFLLSGVGERLIADLRSAVFAHVQRLSLSYYEGQRVGDLTTRITADVDRVQDMLVASLSVLIPNLLVLVGIVAVMLLVDASFALLALAIAPFLFLTVYRYTQQIRRASLTARRREGEVASVVSEALTSMPVVQAYTAEARHYGWFKERSLQRVEAGMRVVGLQAKLSPLVDLIVAVGTIAVLWLGAHRVLSGRMSLGLLLVFLAYISQLYRPMRNLSKLAPILSRGQASAERVKEVLSVEMAIPERPDAVTAPPFRGTVGLRGITFGYQPGHPVLCDVTVEAAPGEVVAIAGLTGGGKSTLMSLICRLHDPWDGQVLIDGRDIREFTLISLRRQVALVLQESILFHGSIYDNIAYGAVAANPEQVFEAAEAAYVDEFVRGLPAGYDTIVSERGTTLSGGQRQRIAIARAMVRNTPIVILDEPTSSLDAVSEQYLMRGLVRLMSGRTVLVIAHRLSTLQRAHRIYVLDGGQVVDCGRHDSLISRPGIYQRMYVASNARFEPVPPVVA